MKDETVQFLQLVCIFTELVPKVLLDVLTRHISKAFQKKFGEKSWDGKCQMHREWLATMMEKNPRVQDFSCAAVRKKPASEWDVTNLSAVLSAVMEPSDVPSDGVAVTQACSKKDVPINYFNVDVSESERRDCKTWEGFSINVTGASPPEVVECVVTKAPSGTQIVAACRDKANDHDLPNKIKKYMPTECRPVYLPLPEVQDIVKVRQSRNALYHRSKTEVSGDEFTQCVTSVRCLIEQVLSPYFPKEDSDGYLTELDRAACTKDFRERCSNNRAVLELFQKALKELECVMEELGGVCELRQEMSQQTEELLREMEHLKSELTERLSCLEGRVNKLEHVVDSHDEAIKQLQMRQLSPPVTEQSPADLLKEKVYEEYQGFKVEGNESNYVKLAVVEKPPSSKPEDVKDKMEAMRRFKHCGTRVAVEKALQVESINLLKKASNRIRIVYGQAGSGKTTLLKQMCRALSCGKAESEFDLVAYFPLRDARVSIASDLQSLLRYYGRDDSRLDHAALAQSLVESKGRGFLLVFDGADEVKDLPPILQDLLHCKSLPDAHIIVSSRPGACPSLQDHSASFYEVQGFDHAAITSYVKGFFGVTPSVADSMLSQLKTRPDLMGGAYIPMNTYILCSIFDPKSSSFPATMTACYQAFAAHTISRECHRVGRKVHIDPTLKVLPKDVDDLMMSLGKLAFDGLCHNPPLFIFDEPSIRTAFPTLPPCAPIDESLFKGLLHVHASRQGYQSSVSCSFPHTTQQEFFAALHLSHLPAKEQERFWQENLSNVSFSVVLRLYAGLTGLGVPKVAKQLHSTAAGSHGLLASFLGLVKGGTRLVNECSNDNPQLLFLFHALCESQNLPLTKEIMQHIPSSVEFKLSLSAFDTMAIAHCLSQCSHLRLLNLPYPCALLFPQCLSHLNMVLQSNKRCELGYALCLRCDHFSAGDAQTLADIAVSLRRVVLFVSHTECTALSTVCSLPSVKELLVTVRSDVKASCRSSLKQKKSSSHVRGHTDSPPVLGDAEEALIPCQFCGQPFAKLVLQQHQDDGEWHLVASSLASNKQLEVLTLDGCDAFLANMGKALSKNTSIRTLHLDRRGPLPDDVGCAISTCVAAMTQFRILLMCDLPLPVMKTLADRTQPLEYLIVHPPGVNWDGLSEEQWMEAEEAIATAKVLGVELWFDFQCTQRQRAVTTITDGLTLNKFVRSVELCYVPEEMHASVKQKLCCSILSVRVY